MNLSRILLNTVLGLVICLCFMMTATPTMAQAANKTRSIGTIVEIDTLLKVSLDDPQPTIHIAALEIYKLVSKEKVMEIEGCEERLCEFDISQLTSGFYRVTVHTNNAEKSFGKIIHVR